MAGETALPVFAMKNYCPLVEKFVQVEQTRLPLLDEVEWANWQLPHDIRERHSVWMQWT